MASITTILGTDSVSSSRIVINNNFVSLNDGLEDITALLDTSTQTITLTGMSTSASLKVRENNVDLFKVESSEIVSNLPATFNGDVTLNKGLMHSVYYDATTLPLANAYEDTTYVLDATAAAFANSILLADADQGQEITLIADGGTIMIEESNIAGVTQPIEIFNQGTLTLRYINDVSEFFVIASSHCTITY